MFGWHLKWCFKLDFSCFSNSGVRLGLGYGIGYMIFGVRGCEVVHMFIEIDREICFEAVAMFLILVFHCALLYCCPKLSSSFRHIVQLDT